MKILDLGRSRKCAVRVKNNATSLSVNNTKILASLIGLLRLPWLPCINQLAGQLCKHTTTEPRSRGRTNYP